MENKKLIFENKEAVTTILRDLKQLFPILEKIKSEYEKLDLGTFENSVFEKIKYSGARSIKKVFESKIEKELNSIGLSIDSLKDQIRKGAVEKFQSFENAVNELKKFRPYYYNSSIIGSIDPKFISFENNRFLVTKNDKENILEEYCRIYIETEQEHNLYNALLNFIDSYSKVTETLKGSSFKTNNIQSKINQLCNQFLTIDENGNYTPDAFFIRCF